MSSWGSGPDITRHITVAFYAESAYREIIITGRISGWPRLALRGKEVRRPLFYPSQKRLIRELVVAREGQYPQNAGWSPVGTIERLPLTAMVFRKWGNDRTESK